MDTKGFCTTCNETAHRYSSHKSTIKYGGERVRSWLKVQLRVGAVIKVSDEPAIFTFPEFKKKWQIFIEKMICPICGDKFLPKNQQEKYCSENCKAKAEYNQKKEYKKQYLKQRRDLTRKAARRYTQKLQNQTQAIKKGRWSEEEVQILKNAYLQKGRLSKKDLVEIALKLGRSYKSVENKYFSEVKR